MHPVAQLIQQLNDKDLWENTLKLGRGAFLKSGGSTDTNLYFIEEGSVRVFLLEENEELTIRFGYPGSVITALDSFITEQPSDFYIQAIRSCHVKVISKERYIKFIDSDPQFQTLWNVLMQQLILQQMERERDLLTSSPAERYQRVLKRSPQLFQEVPHKYIASYLRMTPETLSRLKKS